MTMLSALDELLDLERATTVARLALEHLDPQPADLLEEVDDYFGTR